MEKKLPEQNSNNIFFTELPGWFNSVYFSDMQVPYWESKKVLKLSMRQLNQLLVKIGCADFDHEFYPTAEELQSGT